MCFLPYEIIELDVVNVPRLIVKLIFHFSCWVYLLVLTHVVLFLSFKRLSINCYRRRLVPIYALLFRLLLCLRNYSLHISYFHGLRLSFYCLWESWLLLICGLFLCDKRLLVYILNWLGIWGYLLQRLLFIDLWLSLGDSTLYGLRQSRSFLSVSLRLLLRRWFLFLQE